MILEIYGATSDSYRGDIVMKKKKKKQAGQITVFHTWQSSLFYLSSHGTFPLDELPRLSCLPCHLPGILVSFLCRKRWQERYPSNPGIRFYRLCGYHLSTSAYRCDQTPDIAWRALPYHQASTASNLHQRRNAQLDGIGQQLGVDRVRTDIRSSPGQEGETHPNTHQHSGGRLCRWGGGTARSSKEELIQPASEEQRAEATTSSCLYPWVTVELSIDRVPEWGRRKKWKTMLAKVRDACPRKRNMFFGSILCNQPEWLMSSEDLPWQRHLMDIGVMSVCVHAWMSAWECWCVRVSLCARMCGSLSRISVQSMP